MPTVPIEALMVLLGHRTRRAVLRTLIETGNPTSPVEMSRVLSEPLSNVGYHFRMLEHRQAIRLVGMEPARGSMKHFYVPGRLVHRFRPAVLAVLRACEP